MPVYGRLNPNAFDYNIWYMKRGVNLNWKNAIIAMVFFAIVLWIPYFLTYDIQILSLSLVIEMLFAIFLLGSISVYRKKQFYRQIWMYLMDEPFIKTYDFEKFIENYLKSQYFEFYYHKSDGFGKQIRIKNESFNIDFNCKDNFLSSLFLRDLDGNNESIISDIKENMEIQFNLNSEFNEI